jgi:ADP-ribose pyrophosphatase
MTDALPPPRELCGGRFLRLIAQGHWEYAERTTATGAVAIVAITDDRRIVLVEQFRIPLGCPVIELPAGLTGDVPEDQIPGGDALANSARRELLEETGYEAAEIRHLLTGPTSAGMTNEMVSFYHASGLRRVGSGGGDEHEQIIVHQPRLDELDAWLAERQAAGIGIDPKIFSGLYLIRDWLDPQPRT